MSETNPNKNKNILKVCTKAIFFSHAFTLDHQNQARQMLELLYLLKVYNKTKHLKHKEYF